MIGSAQVAASIEAIGLPVPSTEYQARELAKVPEAQRAEVWQDVVESTNGKPTAAIIAKAREALVAESMRPIGLKITTESQARELAKVPEARRVSCLQLQTPSYLHRPTKARPARRALCGWPRR